MTVDGSVNVPGGSAKALKFKTVKKSVAANQKATFALKLSKKNAGTVKKALRRGKKPKAKLTISATDAAGNTAKAKATIRLKP